MTMSYDLIECGWLPESVHTYLSPMYSPGGLRCDPASRKGRGATKPLNTSPQWECASRLMANLGRIRSIGLPFFV